MAGFLHSMFSAAKELFLAVLPDRLAIPVRYAYRKKSGFLEGEFSILDRLVPPGSVCLDIGANFGFYSYALSKLCARVEYFEPNPVCTKWIKAFGADNIKINVTALSSSPGVAKLHVPIIDGEVRLEEAAIDRSFERESIVDVRVGTLDEYGFTGVGFIKIDAEGHELDIIAGGEQTIRREMPVLLVEIWQGHLSFPIGDVFDRITGLGYDMYYYRGGVFNAVHKGQDGSWSIPASPPGNYIFFPTGKTPPGTVR